MPSLHLCKFNASVMITLYDHSYMLHYIHISIMSLTLFSLKFTLEVQSTIKANNRRSFLAICLAQRRRGQDSTQFQSSNVYVLACSLKYLRNIGAIHTVNACACEELHLPCMKEMDFTLA